MIKVSRTKEFSSYPKIPFKYPSDASLITLFISSTETGFSPKTLSQHKTH